MHSSFARIQTYRTLLGKNSNGDLILLHSGDDGLLSIRDICKLGLKEGIINGLIFDGGSSVEIKVKDNGYVQTVALELKKLNC